MSDPESSTGATILLRLNVEHWAIIGSIAFAIFVVLIFNCWCKTRRWRSVQEVSSGLISAEFLTLHDLPKNAYELITNEAIKERSTQVEPSWRDDCGWGRPSSEYAGVHFKAFISMSLHILESSAKKRHPSLTAYPPRPLKTTKDDFSTSQLACDVEDFMLRLRLAMNGELDDDICSQYLAFYKNARTPGTECTEQEFRSFLGVYQEILRRIER